MTTVTTSNVYDKEARTRTATQTVTYTKADDIQSLAQAQMALANLERSLAQAIHPTVIAQLEEQISGKELEIEELQAIVAGYSEASE